MTAVVETVAEGDVLDLTGHEVFYAGRVARVAEGGRERLRLDGGSEVDRHEVVPLPRLGESVALTMPDGLCEGRWVAITSQSGHPVDDSPWTALIVSGERLCAHQVSAAQVSAARVVAGPVAPAAEVALLRVLRDQVQAHEATRQEHCDWRERLTEMAHAEGDARGWCSEFDDLLEGVGLPRRKTDVEVRLRADVSVYFTVSATSEEEALRDLRESLTTGEVLGRINDYGAGAIDNWEISAD